MFYIKNVCFTKNICFIKNYMFHKKYMFYKKIYVLQKMYVLQKTFFLFADTIFSTRVREGYNALINTQIFARVRKGAQII